MATTDFDHWLKTIELDPDTEFEDINTLYEAVLHTRTCGSFDCLPGKGANQWVIKCPQMVDDDLLLLSDDARQTFLSMMTTFYCGDMDMASWYGYKRGMSKD